MENIEADWTSLPEEVSSRSLWVTLHDGHLESIRSASVPFFDTNGGVYNLDQFQELGGRYSEAFGKRAPDAAE